VLSSSAPTARLSIIASVIAPSHARTLLLAETAVKRDTGPLSVRIPVWPALIPSAVGVMERVTLARIVPRMLDVPMNAITAGKSSLSISFVTTRANPVTVNQAIAVPIAPTNA
jgi:hypothetical protein